MNRGDRSVQVPGDHPLGRYQGRTGEHRVRLYERIGPGPHPCHWCRQVVDWGYGMGAGILVADHVDGDPRNNDPANLVPSCSGCNTSRSRPPYVAEDVSPDDPEWGHWAPTVDQLRALRELLELIGREVSRHDRAKRRPTAGS